MAASDGRKGRPWRRLREQVLAEEPVCRWCRVRPSTVVDHILPRSLYPHLAHERSNLAGSCWPCNGSKHNRLPGQWKPKPARPRSSPLTW
jgi:5-methylcytosine-specific restriction endonuclease McrA